MIIRFYSPAELPYGAFSNFARYSFQADGIRWKTSEHYYQAQKFVHLQECYDRIVAASTPKEAAQLGRSMPMLRNDWEARKIRAMKWALYHKFTQHDDLRVLLLETENWELIENSPVDFYWGCGRSGTGQNMLGKLLMQLRSHLNIKDR